MDVGSFFGALTGGSNPQIEIRFNPPASAALSSSPSTTSSSLSSVMIMDHQPSWRLHKNPFWKVTIGGGGGGTTHDPAAVGGWNNNNNMMMSGNDPSHMILPEHHPGGGGGGYHHNTTATSNVLSASASSPMYIYESTQDIEGIVILRLPSSSSSGTIKKMEHLGIKIMLIGRIDMSMGVHEGRPQYDFTSILKELSPPNVLYQKETIFPFRFKSTMMNDDPNTILESYRGRNVAIRYIIKVSMERKFLPPLIKEQDLWIQVIGIEPKEHEPIKMEVGIEDCLHIEFEYDRRIYHLQDTIHGKIHFLLVRIKIKHMELAVIRRETSGEGVAIAAAAAGDGIPNPQSSSSSNPNMPVTPNPTPMLQMDTQGNNIFTETQTLVKYEIMDGAPIKGEVIPVKLCLRGIPADLTPTYPANNNRFSVRYFLNLVLVDEDDRRYFKQQEIILWRKVIG